MAPANLFGPRRGGSGLLGDAKEARHHHRRNTHARCDHEEERRDPYSEIELRRVHRRVGGDRELPSTLAVAALVEAKPCRLAHDRTRVEGSAVPLPNILECDKLCLVS